MKILNFGSLNIDYVYEVDHFVRPGETLSSRSFSKFCGGKGCNQSIALARAGAKTLHAGKIGMDGLFLKEKLESAGVDCSLLEIAKDEASGHAIIQVAASGENCIILFGGANMTIGERHIRNAMSKMDKGDYLLLQNEISSIPEIMREASAKGLRIFINPAPMNEKVKTYPLELADCLIVNEIEGAELADTEDTSPENIIRELSLKYPKCAVLLTLGSKGAVYSAPDTDNIFVPVVKAKAVDTTAAGDTFCGFFMASLASGKTPDESLKDAALAASICVSRKGAADSIPTRAELNDAVKRAK